MAQRLLPVRELLCSILRNEAPARSFTHFINLCTSIALTHLERKAATGQINRGMIQLSLKDLALDCVADLFRLDEQGIPVQMRMYFECVNLEEASEEETLILLRRLIFSKVKHGLFRTYNEMDPSLGKILRNIKLGVNLTGEFAEGDRFGDTVIAPTRCDSLLCKPMVHKDTIGQILSALPLSDDHVPSMLSALSAYLRSQSDFCRIIPLLPLALAWRDHLSANQPQSPEITDKSDLDLCAQDVRKITLDACEAVKELMKAHYVENRKINEQTYEAYFRAIAATIATEFWEGDEGVTLFRLLQMELPDLTEFDYRTSHRNTAEYLLKLVRKKAKSYLARAFS